MALLKDIVARGIYYDRIGATDYATWKKSMLDYYGHEIMPHMKDIRRWSIVIQNSLAGRQIAKLNCWQFMGCTLQKKVSLFHSIGRHHTCPVLSEKRFDGVHGGINGGRACWVVSYTICCGTIQGNYEEKYEICSTCDFYQSVLEEENNLINPSALMAMLCST